MFHSYSTYLYEINFKKTGTTPSCDQCAPCLKTLDFVELIIITKLENISQPEYNYLATVAIGYHAPQKFSQKQNFENYEILHP